VVFEADNHQEDTTGFELAKNLMSILCLYAFCQCNLPIPNFQTTSDKKVTLVLTLIVQKSVSGVAQPSTILVPYALTKLAVTSKSFQHF